MNLSRAPRHAWMPDSASEHFEAIHSRMESSTDLFRPRRGCRHASRTATTTADSATRPQRPPASRGGACHARAGPVSPHAHSGRRVKAARRARATTQSRSPPAKVVGSVPEQFIVRHRTSHRLEASSLARLHATGRMPPRVHAAGTASYTPEGRDHRRAERCGELRGERNPRPGHAVLHHGRRRRRVAPPAEPRARSPTLPHARTAGNGVRVPPGHQLARQGKAYAAMVNERLGHSSLPRRKWACCKRRACPQSGGHRNNFGGSCHETARCLCLAGGVG